MERQAHGLQDLVLADGELDVVEMQGLGHGSSVSIVGSGRLSTSRSRVSGSIRTSVPGGHSRATWAGRCTTPSTPTTTYSAPSRPSDPTRPPRIVTVRGNVSATSG